MSEHATTDIDNADVNEQLNEFIDQLTDSEPYQQFIESQQQLKADDEAQQLIRDFQQKQQQLQQNGFDQATMKELRELQQDMEENDTIQDVSHAENELIALLEQTNDIISERIGQEFAQTMGGGCC